MKKVLLRRPIILAMLLIWPITFVSAEQLFRLKNGLVIRGSKAEIATLKEGFGAAAAGQINVRPIWLIDDGLRRIYIHGNRMSAGRPIDVADLDRTIELYQPKPLGGKIVDGLGSVVGISPFNDFGRRVLTMRGPDGLVRVVQGITELNSRYAKLIALKGKPTLSWDMRVATSSIDSATLNTIFKRRVDPKDLNARLEVVRFYIAAERYDDAKAALQQAVNDFPGEADLKPQLTALTERQATQLLAEAETRAAAGQYELAHGILNGFPLQEVGRITRLQVQDALKKLDDSRNQAAQLVEQLRGQVAQLDPGQAAALKPIVDEIASGLSADTLARLSDYQQFGQSDTIALENRVALAVAGWLLGSGSGEQNLSIVTSLIEVRNLVAEYLRTLDAGRRETILDSLRTLEGAQPSYVDRMLPLLLPPRELPAGAGSEKVNGMYAIDTGRCQYVIQLPPEYNPLREYPCILALHESRAAPESQIDWWAGPYSERTQSRLGHASRHGFIVVAPVWGRPSQRTFEYTPQEHERVLAAMRDAMRRASIDSDRVFITGHGEGATAAWDMGLAHPDLWAGMISISGSPSKTVAHYEPNARSLPLYMVMGEKDGSRANGSILDSYMSFNHEAIVVMYRGRGREYFYDEIHRLFEWMQLPANKRREIPRDIETVTMRSGDQFFWWLELGELKPDVAIDPILWDQAKRIRAGKVSASIGNGNQIRISGPAEQFRILLRPQPGIDLNDEVIIRYGSRPRRFQYDGSLNGMLEDARQRADRKRPFWVTFQVP
jgi:pimeloyl-ACP methyl ester carboxylesterase